MPRTSRSRFALLLSFVLALSSASVIACAAAADAAPDSLGARREWTLAAGPASGYGYGVEPRPMPADLRHLKPAASVSAGLWRQRAAGRGFGLRVDGMQYND